MDKFLQQLADRLQIPDSEIITTDETKDWPEGKLNELVSKGILEEIEHASGVVCNQCEENCFIEPDIRTDPNTGKPTGIYVCTRNPDISRFTVDLEKFLGGMKRKVKISAIPIKPILTIKGSSGLRS